MKFLVGTAAALWCLCAAVYAAPKPGVVLMPVQFKEDRSMQGPMETAVVQGLQSNYKVYSGEKVSKKVEEIYSRESAVQKECDEGRCFQKLSTAFDAELIAILKIINVGGDYVLTLTVKNIVTEEDVLSRQDTCKGCSALDVLDNVKALAGADQAPVAAAAALPVAGNSQEDQFWRAIEANPNLDDYEMYMAEYPRGKYLALAKMRIQKLKEDADRAAWQTAQEADTESAYKNYLNVSPSGSYVVLAKAKLAKIEKNRSEQQETEMWSDAKSSRSSALIQDYLEAYPSGRYQADAKALLAVVLKEEDARVADESRRAAEQERARAERQALWEQQQAQQAEAQRKQKKNRQTLSF